MRNRILNLNVVKGLLELVENKVVVITGASSGIGQATATRLAQAGAKVVFSARRVERLVNIKGVLYGIAAAVPIMEHRPPIFGDDYLSWHGCDRATYTYHDNG